MSRILYFVGPIILIWISIPLACFAAITSTLAFSTLFIRVAIVYFELAIALARSWLFIGSRSSRLNTKSPSSLSSNTTSPNRQRRRRRSSSIAIPVGELARGHRPPTKSESFASLLGSNGPTRDFEGVGGWSLKSDEQEDSIWIGLNSRLELPTPSGDHPRRHRRSLTSQSQRFTRSPEATRMSPTTSRTRTPNAIEGLVNSDGYFNLHDGEAIVMSPEESAAKTRMHERQTIIDRTSASSPSRPFTKDSHVLDVGAGAGSLTLKVFARCQDARVLATDISKGMLEEIDALKLPNVATKRENAVGLASLKDDTFNHFTTSIAIQFTLDAAEAVRSMYRVLAPGGTAGIVIWGPRTDPDVIHGKACKRLKPDYVPVMAATAGSWVDEESHRAAMEEAEFKNVTVETMILPFKFAAASKFLEYWFGYDNPVPRKLHEDCVAKGGNLEALRLEMEVVVREEYDDGAGMCMSAVTGIGQK